MEQGKFGTEFWEGLTKAATWAFSILIGLMAKISHDLLLKKKRSTWQWVAVGVISVFVGVLVSRYCLSNGYEKQAQIIVPIATLLGEKIILYVTANWEKFINLAVDFVKTKK